MANGQQREEKNETIVVNNLVKRFGNFTAVNGVSFSVKKGEIFGLLGANGSGKTTTIRMLCGIITPTAGEGWVAGFNIYTQTEEIKKSIGYMSQKFSLYEDLTLEENLRFYLGIYTVPKTLWRERIDWIIEMTNVGDMRKRITGELPQGWRQRLALGCALIHKPSILFLDEPTSGVDPATRKRFWKLIEQITDEGVTVLLTTHYMDEARNCNRIAMMNAGRIVATGMPEEIIAQACPHRKNADLNDAFINIIAANT
ncbi:MAG: ABC transporter ATP-binding protein [Syntrophales bacterium]|nr:ABC transporter ATP-binding protein [Syntrophales bacterium]